MKGMLIYPNGHCETVTFPENEPSLALSGDAPVNHVELGALYHRGNFGIFCEYGENNKNKIATSIVNLLNFEAKNADHPIVRGCAIFYKDDGDVTADDWAYVGSMMMAKCTREPTDLFKESVKKRFADKSASGLAAVFRQRHNAEIKLFWGEKIGE